MPRFLSVSVCVALAAALCLSGCKGKPKEGGGPLAFGPNDPEDGNLELELPYTIDPREGRDETVAKLTVDGKDFTAFATEKKTVDGVEKVIKSAIPNRRVKVTPEAGKDTVKVVYSFWPVGWSNTVRTKEVKLKAEGVTRVSLKADDDETDKVFPIFYPTPVSVVDAMCKMANVAADDVVYDIGCGDGRVVIGAVKRFNAKKGVGIELDKDLVAKCKEDAKKAGVEDKTVWRNEDALKIKDYSEASVVLLYVGDQFGKILGPFLKKALKPGSRIVSHRFLLGDWEPDRTVRKSLKNNYGDDEDYTLHIWTIKP